jgi:hypothetical protein
MVTSSLKRCILHRMARPLSVARLPPSLQGLTLVPISAQLELTLPLSAQLKLTVSPIEPNLTRGCVPKVLKLSSDVRAMCPKGPQVEL